MKRSRSVKVLLCILGGMFFMTGLDVRADQGIAEEGKVYRLEMEIDAPPKFLYPYLIDEDRIAKWQRDDSVIVTFPNGIQPRIGKQIRVEMKFLMHPWMLMEIVRLDPGEYVQTDFIDGVLTGSFAYILQPNGRGGTRFIHEIRIRPVGVFMTVIWKIHGERMHRNKMKMFMKNIKELVEADYRLQQSSLQETE